MPRDLSGLGTRKMPDPSTLKGASGYLEQYNQKYADLAQGLLEAMRILREKYKKGFQNVQMGGLEYEFVQDDTKDTFNVVVKPSNRWYPQELIGRESVSPVRVGIPSDQLRMLIADLEDIGLYTGEKDARGTSSDKKLAASIIHRIFLTQDKPLESLVLEFQRDGELYTPVGYTREIHPESVKEETYIGHKLNSALAALATTESADNIPIPYNRLALIDAVIWHLIDEIEKREGRTVKGIEGLKALRSPQELVQPSLFSLG